ncbi:MAG: carboxypeptidase regulatory-like domain-containing protein [Blastocatellia bacterium]
MTIIPAYTQNKKPVESNLRVTIVDPAGAAVLNARVSLNKQNRTVVTNARGEASFSQLPPGKVQLQITADGFAPRTIKDFNLKPGPNQIEVKLEIATVQEEVTVGRDKREASTDPRGDAFTTVLTAEQLAQLPDDPEEFEQAIRNMAGPGATFRVNGFRGGKLPPKNQIREIRFRTNAYAAESHEASFISVDIYTKPGLNNWHGSFNFGFRDESLNARNAFARFRAPEQNRRFGFEFGGPLRKKRTSLFLSADGVNSFEAKTIVAALPGESYLDQIRQPWRTLNLNARVEHLLTPTHTARVEYQRNATRRDNNGVGNFDFPERGFTTDTAEQLFRFADSGVVGKKLFNEIRFQARWEGVEIDSLSNQQTIQVLNAFTRGGAQVASERRVREFEIADNLDVTLKKHTLRFGFLIEAANYQSDELRNQNGTFVFSSLDAFRAGRPTTFTQRSGAGRVDFNQVQLGWYAQDDWRVRKSLTLSYGLRHEWQNTLDDANNFMPRAGVAWSPFKKGNTTIRGGAGIFYDWFASESYEQALRVNGQQQSDLVVRNPGFPDPLAGGAAVILPASRIRIDPALQMPYIARTSIGIEQSLSGNTRLMAQYAFTRGLHATRGRNINAPIDGLRPDPSAGNITQIESSARSSNHTLMINLNVMKMGKYTLGASYVWSKATNETDGPLSLPADNFNLRGERGPSAQDIRHRVFVLSTYTLPKGFRLSSIFQANSATPYNITTGFDDNSDTVINDRPSGVSRNSGRGAGRWDVSTRMAWGFSFGKKPEAASGGGPQIRIIRGDSDAGSMLGTMGSLPGMNDKRYRTEFFIQATNLFNHTNPIGFSGVQTSPFFGQPTAALPGRRIETGMRFSF